MTRIRQRLNRVETAAGHGLDHVMTPRRIAYELSLAGGLPKLQADHLADAYAASGFGATAYDFFTWLDSNEESP